jgi:hypothetical protein
VRIISPPRRVQEEEKKEEEKREEEKNQEDQEVEAITRLLDPGVSVEEGASALDSMAWVREKEEAIRLVNTPMTTEYWGPTLMDHNVQPLPSQERGWKSPSLEIPDKDQEEEEE